MNDCGNIKGIQNIHFRKKKKKIPEVYKPKLQLFKMEFQELHHIVTRSI